MKQDKTVSIKVIAYLLVPVKGLVIFSYGMNRATFGVIRALVKVNMSEHINLL